jgi:hypothetical protein
MHKTEGNGNNTAKSRDLETKRDQEGDAKHIVLKCPEMEIGETNLYTVNG